MVVLNGISEIISVFLSSCLILARTLTLPPLMPLLYLVKSAIPPVLKSGNNSNSLPRRNLIDASISSLKLCGSNLEASPTAIPSTPCANNRGNFTGNVTGSLFLPSYEDFHSVVFGLNTTSFANLESRASIYLGAAARSPVKVLPQFPWVSMSISFCPNCTSASPMEASPCGWNCMVWPIILATLLNLPSSRRLMACNILLCTGFKPSYSSGTARSRIT